MSKAMEKIKVLDFSQALAGPYCTMMLGDSGAEVLKIERPGTGDMSRAWGAEFAEGMNSYFASVNRNKKSLTIKVDTNEGLRIIHELVRQSDVIVENFRPGVTQKLGIDYETLKEINPKIIYCSITGFGNIGPQKNYPGFDLIAQGMGGIMGLTGEPGRNPVKVGVSIADITAGMFAAFAVMRALYDREICNTGQKIDTSLLEGQIALLTFQAGSFFATGESPKRAGNTHPFIAPYETFPTQDGYINIAAGNDGLWAKLCQSLELENLEKDQRFDTNTKRVQNRDKLIPILEEQTKKYNTEEILELLNNAGIPAGPVNSLKELFESNQVKALEMVKEVNHPKIGTIKVTDSPINYSSYPDKVSLPPPLLGEHTAEVLRNELNMENNEINNLKQKGVI